MIAIKEGNIGKMKQKIILDRNIEPAESPSDYISRKIRTNQSHFPSGSRTGSVILRFSPFPISILLLPLSWY